MKKKKSRKEMIQSERAKEDEEDLEKVKDNILITGNASPLLEDMEENFEEEFELNILK